MVFTGWAVCLLLFIGGCSRPAAPLSVAPDQPTEQRWIIGDIARDAVGMAVFAAAPERWTDLPADAVSVRESAGNAPGQAYSLHLTLPGVGDPIVGDLKLAASVWSPGLYVPTLRALFTRLKIDPPATTDPNEDQEGANLLKILANPLTAEIETQNRRLSDELQAHPLDARAHEQAALLLGTLAMRENSGLFWNPRGLCNRAVAHLAFARALRPEASECGEVAELLVGLIIDTKADCQKRIAALQTQVAAHPELGPWATAAAMRNTRDYRLLTNPRNATFLERVEQFRAMSEAINAEQAVERVENQQPATAPDWGRMVLQGDYSVDSGHRFALRAVGLELNDAVQIFPELRTARAPAQFAAVYNPPPGDAVQADENHRPRFHVIDRGIWAQFFQRHLLHAAGGAYDFLQHKWGVPDEARSFRVQMGPLLKPLTLYPLCLGSLGKEDGDALFPRAADLINQHMEWVGDGAWGTMVKGVPLRYAKGGSWQKVIGAWFSPRLPVGTAYGFDWRAEYSKTLPTPGLPELQAVYNVAALKYDVSRLYLNARTPGRLPSPAEFRQTMGLLLAYYLPAITGEAQLVKDDPAQYGALINQAAALNPNYDLVLGRYYVDHRMEPEAAQAYQAAIDHGADAVSVYSSTGWLVNYYYDHGQQARALAIAERGAEVYSFNGLETMASLMERMDRIPEAESYYAKISERYRDARPVNLFYTRQAPTHPEYREKMQAAEKDIFPQGIEDVTLDRLVGKPTKGVVVHGENALSRQFGLKPGAIIVGIDGKRVRNINQYFYVRALKDSPQIDLLVYQDGHYQAISAQVPGRKFNLVFTTWP